MLINSVVQLAPIWIPRGIPLQHLQCLLFIPGLFRQSENGVDLLRHLGRGAEVESRAASSIDDFYQ